MDAVRLGYEYVVALVMLLLPAAACVLIARRYGVRNPVLLLACGFVGSGLLGFAVFWLYLFAARVGHGAALAVDLGAAVVMGNACRRRFALWRQLRSLAPVTAVFATSGLFNLALGYLHGGLSAKADIAPNRYLAGLPGDNALPFLFARQLESHVRPLPHFLAWGYQSSDRPPLQTGYYLLEQAVVRNSGFDVYQVFSTLVESTWVFGLWALLYAARRPRWTIPLSLAAGLFSSFTIINTFFTWPKFVSATGALLCCAVVLSPEMRGLNRSKLAGALAGGSLGVSLLGHPSGVFAVPAIALVLFILWVFAAVRPRDWALPTWPVLLSATAAIFIAYIPWMLYQRLYQPPANALLELQLANQSNPVRGKSTMHVIASAYEKLSAHQLVSYKISNLTTPFSHTFDSLTQTGSVAFHSLLGQNTAAAAAASRLINIQFFFIGPILGIVGWGIVLLLLRGIVTGIRRRPQPDGASWELLWLLVLALTVFGWAMVLFGPGATVAHQGTYIVEPVCFALGVLGWWSVSPKAAVAVVAASSALTLWTFIRFTPNAAVKTPGMTAHTSVSVGLLLAASVLACLASLWWLGISTRTEPVATDRLVVRPRTAHMSQTEPAAGQ
ncbi:hypothetical protein KGA66_13810 [Actinocrinis puniceicyclus]|uniref:Uncharacterized protein n=1 Tax=Actinocrinis puniceicyclus TaxID=977794 RepID=A0A8J7WRM9_9ACTN|nr:hypothetical protein [Actinocrinis puniceicyclus]MBS2964129.1 hypothetical protein [Actinocrinis puniceicyclus]